MRRVATILPFCTLAAAANAQTKGADERLFESFLPLMIGVGIFIAVFVIALNVFVARRRASRTPPPFFDPTLGAGPSPFAAAPTSPPRIVSKKTTTTNADGSVTVTVIEETIVGSTPFGNANGVVDSEIFAGEELGRKLEQEIRTEVRDAFRRMGSQTKDL